MKVYVLTCINADSELVFARVFRTKKEAQSSMRRSVESMRLHFEENYGECYKEMENDGAAIGNESKCFIYDITEAEL